ncbi:MAG: DUF6677 family protein [Vicinamibacterales bacterium]
MTTSSSSAAPRDRRTVTDDETRRGGAWVVVVAWFIPGGGHLVQGQVGRGLVFFCTLALMFALGCGFSGRIFPFQLSDPLIFLAALAQWGLGLPRLLAAMFGWGAGTVTATTYEYGNTFLITSGLLNTLVLLDAYDVAMGRRSR